MSVFAGLEQTLVRLAGLLIVAFVLLLSVQSLHVPDVPAGIVGLTVLGAPLWALGRYTWSRRGAHGRTLDRLKPRRRTLPPPPTFENGDVHLPQGRTPRRPP